MKQRLLRIIAGVSAAMALSGCGGSSDGRATNPIRVVSEYYGVYRSGGTVLDAGTLDLFVSSNGSAHLGLVSVNGAKFAYTGTQSGDSMTLKDSNGDTFKAKLAVDAATKQLTGTFQHNDGATGAFYSGQVGYMVPLPLQSTGAYSSTSGESGTLSLYADSNRFQGTATTSGGSAYPVVGVYDDAGAYYFAYKNSEGFETAVSVGVDAAKQGTLAETPSGQTVTLAPSLIDFSKRRSASDGTDGV